MRYAALMVLSIAIGASLLATGLVSGCGGGGKSSGMTWDEFQKAFETFGPQFRDGGAVTLTKADLLRVVGQPASVDKPGGESYVYLTYRLKDGTAVVKVDQLSWDEVPSPSGKPNPIFLVKENMSFAGR